MSNKGSNFGRGGFKKHFNGKFGATSKGSEVCFGEWGLISLSSGELKENHIGAMTKVIKRNLKDRGRVYVRVYPDYSVTKKTRDSTLGGGAGKFDHTAAFVKAGKILLEIAGLSPVESKSVLGIVASRCPLKTRVIERRSHV